MVAIITGTGFGIARSSAALLGGQGQLGAAAMGRGNDRVYVNAANGNLVIDRTDDVLTGVGPDEAYSLTYNSEDPSTLSGTAMAWNLGTYHRITNITGTVNTAGSTATRVDRDGSTTLFTYDSSKGYYTSQDGPGATNELRFANNAWTWTDGSTRTSETYGSVVGQYFLTAVTDCDGNTQTYTYTASGTLDRITEANGDYMVVTWNGARPSGVTTSYTNASGLQTLTRVRYTWDSAYRLTSATIDLTPQDGSVADGNVYTTTYGYDGTSQRVASITQSDGSRLDIGYSQGGSTYYVTSLTETVSTGVTRVTGFYYDLVNRVTTITDPLGGVTTMSYDASGNLTQLTRPVPAPGAAAPTTSFTYTPAGDVASLTENGRTTAYTYDAAGNLTLMRDAAGNTVTRTYGTKNELLTETRWLVPDPDGAGPGAASAPATTRYAYDSENHVRFSVSAEGDVTEYQYNAPGQLTATIVYAGGKYDVTGLQPTATLSEATLQSWTATTDRTNAERTDTAYDARGNVHTVTRYSALDGAGAGIASAGYSQDTYVYDQAGLLLSRVNNASPASEVFVYDGLGRVVSATDMANATTITAFNDAASTTTVTSSATGLTRVSVYDKAGELVSTTESGADVPTAVTTAAYDGLGRVRVETDATSRSTYHVYDAASRKVADVTADGTVTEYGYDSTDRLVRKIDYMNKLSTSQIALLSGFAAGGGGGAGKGGVSGPVGSTLLVNGSFDQIDGGSTADANGYTGSLLPGWTKNDPTFVQQIGSGQLGVAASDGGYWLDLDSLAQSGIVATGSNHVFNASFETSAAGATNSGTVVTGTTLPNWTAANPQPFQQVSSGQGGVSATDGLYWLDLDSTLQTGIVTTGGNLLQNGSFETSAANATAVSGGFSGTTLPYWSSAGPQLFQQLSSGQGGIAATNGSYWLDLDSVSQTGWAGSGSNLLTNGSFETFDLTAGTLSGWAKDNPEAFQPTASGTGGVTASAGSYWLDLDSTRQTGVAAVGNNLLTNGSFDTSGTGAVATGTGYSSTTLPGWTATNPQPFQQVASGQMGVTGSDGAYWLDLDSTMQTGWAPGSTNLLTNGSFDASGSGSTIAGWTKTNPQPFDVVPSGQMGITASDGANWLDLDSTMQTGVAPTGANLLSNGGFETSGANYTTTASGRYNTSLPGWSNANAAGFDQMASGQRGVSATEGSYWLDLDGTVQTRVATGANLLVNGSFEQATNPSSVVGGRSSSSIPGWTNTTSAPFTEIVSGQKGVAASDGGYWLDLWSSGGLVEGTNYVANGSFEQVTGTPTTNTNGQLYASIPSWTKTASSRGFEIVNSGTFGTTATDGSVFLDMGQLDMSQTVTLATTTTTTIAFDYSNTAGTINGAEGPEPGAVLTVWWNGFQIATIGNAATTPVRMAYQVSGRAGANTLRFTSSSNAGHGATIDNVKVYQSSQQTSGGTMDVKQTVGGLAAGQVMQLQFDHALAPIQVLWNGQLVDTVPAGINNDVATSSYFVTALAGSNVLEFKGATSDAMLDNVRLLATQVSATPVNMDISQNVGGLAAGQTMWLQFDTANAAPAGSGSFNVLWNGQVIDTITSTGTGMLAKTYQVTAVAGNNTIGFRGTGTADDVGASIDNVRLFATQPVYTPGNMDIKQTVAGLTAGQMMSLQFDYANRTTSASGSFDVLWNGQVIDSISTTGTAMQTKSYFVAAIAGSNVIEFRGTGTADDVGASLDNVRLTAAQAVYTPGNMDIKQAVAGLAAGQVMQLQFDYANRTTAASGSFQVLWNGQVIDTISDTGTAIRSKTYVVTAAGGTDQLEFRGTGTADDVGASLDNVRLFATQPVFTAGNMDIHQTVSGLTAGQTMQLQFNYANRTTAASGSFEVWWNGQLLDTIADTGTAMRQKVYFVTAVAGNNVVRFRGTGTADDVGASIDDVRLLVAQPVYTPGNMDISQTVNGLATGQLMQLQFDYASRAAAGSGSFEVWWNNQLLETITDGTTAMRNKVYTVTALAGANTVRFRGTGTADDVGASLDNVALFATQPVYTSGNMDISQAISGLSAGQLMQLQFDHANRTTAASGSFDVLWNNQVVATITDSGTTMKTETFTVTAAAGSNVLRFRGTGSADDVGASLDNVRLFDTRPGLVPGNVDVSQTVSALAAGETVQLQFDHANRTSSASGSFQVLWNDQVVATITDSGTTMKTETLLLTAIAGTNKLAFRGTGTADDAGASLDNVRLFRVGGSAPAAPTPTDPLAALRPGASSNDLWTWHVYDAADRVIETMDSAGRAESFVYDGDSRLTGSTAYANLLDAGTIAALKAASPTAPVLPAANAATDRPVRRFYDSDGLLVGSLDGTGGLSQTFYDAAGRKIREIAYATPAPAGSWSSGSFATLLASVGASAADRRIDYAYDDRGLLRFTIDAAGRPTELVYDSADRVIRTVDYSGSIAAPAGGAAYSVAYVQSHLVAGAADRTTRSVYDDAGRLAFTIDAEGGATALSYDAAGRAVKQTGFAALFGTAGDQSLSAMQSWAAAHAADSANRVSRSVYDAAGELAFTVDAEGYVTEHRYDAAGRRSQDIRYAGVYSVADGVTKASLSGQIGGVPGDAVVTTYGYDAGGRLTDVTDGENVTTHYVLDAHGQAIDTIVAYGTADAATVHRVYDAAGRVTSETQAYGTAAAATVAYAYDGVGNLIADTDARGFTSTRGYDPLGRVTSVTVPLDASTNAVTTNAYDAFGDLVRSTDPRGNSTFFYFDGLGRLTLQVDPEGFATATAYTSFGQPAAVTRYAARTSGSPAIGAPPAITAGAGDAVTHFDYDRLGRLLVATDAEGYYEQYTLNAFGDRVQVRNKLGGVTINTYDRRGLLTSETLPVNSVRGSDGAVLASSVTNSFQYDARGNRTQMVEAAGLPEHRTTSYQYDKRDRLIQTVQDAVQVTGQDLASSAWVTPTETITYDRRGNVIQAVDATGGRALFYYDSANRKIASVDPAGTLSAWTYDTNGNVLTARVYGDIIGLPATPGGSPPAPANAGNYREASYAYDRANRRVSITVAGLTSGEDMAGTYTTTTGAVSTQMVYDAAGNVVRSIDGRGNSIWSFYDRDGRQTAQVDKENYLTVWTRDAEGNATAETRYAVRVATAFDQTSAVASLQASAGTSGDDRTTSFTYDRNGQRLTETRANLAYATVSSSGALASGTGSATVVYSYNGLGEVTRKTEATGDYTDYSYDAGGRQTSVTSSALVDYTGASTQRSTVNSYDGLGNLTRSVQNGTRTTTYAYGAGGRLAAMTDASGFTRSYGYDAAGRVVKESWTRTRSDGSQATEANATRYDAAGRAVFQAAASWNGSSWSFGDQTQIRYDAYGEVTGKGLNGLWQETFDYDAGGRLWRSTAGDGTVKILVSDRNGNATLTIASSGADLSGDSLASALARFGANLGSAAAGAVATVAVLDKRGQQVGERDPFRQLDGGTTATVSTACTYNAFGETTSETDARGYVTNYSYNAMGRLIQKQSPTVSWTDEQGNVASARPTETYYYDLSGRLVGMSDANGNLTTRALLAGTGYGGADALVAKEFHADGGVVQTGFDVFGDARTLVDELGRVESRSYDAMDRLVSVAHRGGLLTDTYAYDGLGRRIGHANNVYVGAVERTDYDLAGRVVLQTDLTGAGTSYSYAWNGAMTTSGLGTFGGWVKTSVNAAGLSATDSLDYFGHAVAHSDFGGHAFSYGYNAAAQVVSMSSSAGAGVSYAYYNTGKLSQVVDNAGAGYDALTSTYGYDAAGNRTFEGVAGTVYSYYLPSGTTATSASLQSTTATYDALGRIATITDLDGGGNLRSSSTTSYDLAGNIRHVASSNVNLAYPQYGQQPKDLWYRYDSMNRMVVADGSLSNGTIVAGVLGAAMTYDLAGQRRTMTHDAGLTGQAYVWVPDQSGGGIRPIEIDPGGGEGGHYEYQTAYYNGQRREEYSYRDDGYLMQVAIAETGYTDNGDGTVSPTDLPPAGALRGDYQRDALGRVTEERQWDTNGQVSFDRNAISYDAANLVQSETVNQLKVESGSSGPHTYTYVSTTTNGYNPGGVLATSSVHSTKSGYGIQTDYAHQDAAAPDTYTSNAYTWWDDARLSSSSYNPDTYYSTTQASTYAYDGEGRIAYVDIADGRRRTVSFASAAGGQVLQRTERSAATANPEDHYAFLDGRQVAFVTNNGNNDPTRMDYSQGIRTAEEWSTATGSANQSFRWGTTGGVTDSLLGPGAGYNPIDPANNAGNDTRYTVQAGDTLQGIAAAVWGDPAMWYLIADANGLTGGEALQAGQTLTVPAKVTNIHNSAGTFRVYDPTKALGDLSPTAPKPVKGHQGGCGVVGAIILIAIAVAVTVIVAPQLTPFLTQAFAAGAAPAAAGTAVVAGTTVAVGSGAAIAGGIASGIITGALASVVSQGIGVATGLQDKFSWKGVALAAISGGVSGGVGGSGLFSKVAGSVFLGDAIRGSVSNAASQGIAVATGLQRTFSWTDVAVAGVAAGVEGAASRWLPGSGRYDLQLRNGAALHLQLPPSAWNSALSGAAGSIAGAAARSALSGTDFGDNLVAVLPDVIGTTIGTVVASEIAARFGHGEDGKDDEPAPPAPAAAIPGTGNVPFTPGTVLPGVSYATGVPFAPVPPSLLPNELTGAAITAAMNHVVPIQFQNVPIQPSDTTDTHLAVRIKIGSLPGVDPSIIVEALGQLPRSALLFIRHQHIKFAATQSSVVEYMPELHDTRPQGHENYDQMGRPPLWDFTSGTYNRNKNVVVIGVDGKYATGSANFVLHELGHAIDWKLGHGHYASGQGAFTTAYGNAVTATAFNPLNESYYMPSNTAYLSETFAESFAAHYGLSAATSPGAVHIPNGYTANGHSILNGRTDLSQYWSNLWH